MAAEAAVTLQRPISVGDGRTRAVSIEHDSTMPGLPKTQMSKLDKDKMKIGHRRVDGAGQVTYKKKTTSELMAAIQLGIGQSVGRLAPKARRDVLYEDFHIVETVFYPSQGGSQTPAHHYSDFSFKTYAPVAFQYFRELFGIQTDDYLLSLCNEGLRELSNPGASGSIFYISEDDEFIIKTVQHKEANFLQKLLPGYYMNLNQNRATLLPKFYGLYCYQCGGKNIRFVVMNNLLPSSVKLHAKYDLKGSTYKRRASGRERTKSSPTFKDLDFGEINPEGIFLEADTRDALKKTIERDCRVLQSFKIMDYSFLLGVHNMDIAKKDSMSSTNGAAGFSLDTTDIYDPNKQLIRTKSMRQRVAQFSTAMAAIQAPSEAFDDEDTDVLSGGIPARSSRGEQLVLFVGIIDVLQSYRFAKKLEHTFKAMVTDGDSISVHRPGFYAQRFQAFLNDTVFRKMPAADLTQSKSSRMRFKKLVQLALRHSPSKRKMLEHQKSIVDASFGSVARDPTVSAFEEEGAVGGRPDILSDGLSSRVAHASASDVTHSINQLSKPRDRELRISMSSITAIATVEVPPKLFGEVENTVDRDAAVQRKSNGSETCEDVQRTALDLTDDEAAKNILAVTDPISLEVPVTAAASSSSALTYTSDARSLDATTNGYLASGSGNVTDSSGIIDNQSAMNMDEE